MTTSLSTYEQSAIEIIPKRKSHAFRKDVYLVGRLKDSRELIWLEAPSWDCDWYWGFGYLEVYTTQSSPNTSKDITMHTHWNSEIKNNLDVFSKTTFNESEWLELCRLFDKFYELKDIAASSHWTNEAAYNKANKIDIPAVTSSIINILTPSK